LALLEETENAKRMALSPLFVQAKKKLSHKNRVIEGTPTRDNESEDWNYYQILFSKRSI